MSVPKAFGLSRAEVTDPDAPFGYDRKGKAKAPFGYRRDGAIKLRPGRTGAGGQGGTKAAAPKAPARPKGRPSSGNNSRSGRRTDYTAGIQKIGQDIVEVLIVGGLTKDEILLADAAVAAELVDPVAEGLNELAGNVPWLALALDRLNTVAPYTGLAGALSTGVAQLLANHVPKLRSHLVGAGLAVEPRLLMAKVRQAKAQELARAAQEAADAEAEADEAMAAAGAALAAVRARQEAPEWEPVPHDGGGVTAGFDQPPPSPTGDELASPEWTTYAAGAGADETAELDELYADNGG